MSLSIVKEKGVLFDRQVLTWRELALVAELADAEAWSLLVSLAENLGQDQLAAEFRAAMAQEEAHRARLRTWLSCLPRRAGEVARLG